MTPDSFISYQLYRKHVRRALVDLGWAIFGLGCAAVYGYIVYVGTDRFQVRDVHVVVMILLLLCAFVGILETWRVWSEIKAALYYRVLYRGQIRSHEKAMAQQQAERDQQPQRVVLP